MWSILTILSGIIAVLAVFTIIVFVHEMGHFLVARRCGVFVETFSIGFGPEIKGWNDKHGTRWRISALPLGGYVKFLGDADAASTPDFNATLPIEDKRRTLSGQNVWRRIAIVFAGPLANFIFSLIVFTVLIFFFSETVVGTPIVKIAELSEENDTAKKAGFLAGDILLKIDDKAISGPFDIIQAVNLSPSDTPLSFLIKRDGQEKLISVVPKSFIGETPMGKMRQAQIGIKLGFVEGSFTTRKYGFLESINAASAQMVNVVTSNSRMLYLAVSGKVHSDAVMGTFRGAEAIGRIGSRFDILLLIAITASLSVWLGVMNLLPIPVLDGGHLVFYFFEAALGHPVNEKIQEIAFRIGFVVIIFLTFVVLGLDTKFNMIHW